MNVIITGTPGTGKTTVAKALAKRLAIPYVNVLSIIKKKHMYTTKYKGSLVVNTKQLEKELKKHKGIMESHLLCEMKLPGPIFVLRASPRALYHRLSKRFLRSKVKENIEAEVLDYCFIYAKQNYKKVYQANTTSKTVSAVASEIISILRSPRSYKKKTIDWTPHFFKQL